MEHSISRRTALKIAAVGLAGIAIPSLTPKMAHATNWSALASATWESPIGSITISARNGISKSGLNGTAYTQATTSKAVPAGYLNAVAKLTDGAGLIIGSTRLAKNATTGSSVTASVSGNSGTGFQSRGWAFNLYSSSARYVYPAWPSARSANHYNTNANGLTFGSILDAGSLNDLPDLVAVRTDEGVAGYSYKNEICPTPQTKEEAELIGKIDSIRVYADDGETLLGVHSVGQPYEAL